MMLLEVPLLYKIRNNGKPKNNSRDWVLTKKTVESCHEPDVII
jgi:hypothetical protein